MLASQSIASLVQRVCDARIPLCPRCGKALRRIHTGRGGFVAQCENVVREESRATGRGVQREKCGQHVHVLGAGEGVAIVTGISEQLYKTFRAEGEIPRAADVYHTLGILNLRDTLGPEGVAEGTCAKCTRMTKLSDLYGGTCRWCRDGLSRPDAQLEPGATYSAGSGGAR